MKSPVNLRKITSLISIIVSHYIKKKINKKKSGNESLGMILTKGEMLSSENITSTNEVSILPIPNKKSGLHTSTPNNDQQKHVQQIGNLIIRPVMRQVMSDANLSRSSQSTPSPSTTTANITTETNDNLHFDPIIKMEVADDDEDTNDERNNCGEPKSCENGNFNYVGDYIAAELNKLPLRDAFTLKNILIREVLAFSEKLLMAHEKQ